ncbi:hypothetical protein D3C84_1046840 [compost metagenome]
MAENAGEYAFGVLTGKCVSVGMANTGRNDANQNLTGLRRLNINLNNLKRLIRAECNSCARLDHGNGYLLTVIKVTQQ